ncbi:OmpP1/FadL family transporter [Acinetobacter celticus]|uniref:Transporter n=1 Tax=Acinetobacter celticus TaxID=1891224 RepID=A0A1C3CXB8_9GAMM|nr:outer membrane protein transport protein [Acinetobacter celticus]ODA13269.1 transporter [Acinetobacter celticus]
MKLKKLTTALILATLPATGAFAAALDRSGQSIAAFLQPGNYFEAGISVLDPNVSGKMNSTAPASNPTLGALANTSLDDMAGDYYFPQAALKLQLTDNFSFGIIYDQPFGADATYSSSDATLSAPGAPGAFQLMGETTEVEVKSQNISMLFGFQPIENINIYGGGVYQTVKGDVKLRGIAYGANQALGLYNASIKEDSAVGWLAGLAYQIPEIALKASVTYRSEIKHEAGTTESGVSALLGGPFSLNSNTNITTPQSVNLDFQTGIMANTVAFANVRWVDWSNFAIRPTAFGNASETLGALGRGPVGGFDLVAYTDDQINATVGIGRKINEQWAGNVSVGWDSGAGNPVSTLGPTEGYWNVGLGVQFSPAPNYFIAGGVKYFMLGDAEAQPASMFGTNESVAKFEDNDAWAYGLKIGYKF